MGSARLLRGEVERPRVGREGERLDPAVEGLRERPLRARLPVEDHEPPAVGLVAGPQLRAPGEEAAVRAVAAAAVVPRGLGDPLRRAAGGRHHEHVGVRAPGLVLPVLAREAGLLSVGRDGPVLVPEAERRSVVAARGEVDRGPALDRHHEEVVAPTVVPGVPVAEEEVVVRAGRGGLARLAERLRVAGVVGAAVREDLGDDEQALRVDPLEGVRTGRERGELARLAAGEVERPHLRGAVPRGEEGDPRPVRAPPGARVRGGIRRDPPRLAARDRDEPQVRVALAPGEVDLGEREGHPRPVRRDLRVGQAPELHHLGGGEGRRGGARGRREAGEAQGERAGKRGLMGNLRGVGRDRRRRSRRPCAS